MAARIRFIGILIVLAAVSSLVYGLNYMYYSDLETTRFGDVVKFWGGDTLMGPVRSNDRIAIMQSPEFFDFVISSAGDFWRGSAYNPHFLDEYDPVFNAPRLELPTRAEHIREMAIAQQHYFYAGDSMQARVQVMPDRLKIWWSSLGMPFDTANYGFYTLPDSAVVFFDCPKLQIFGTIGTNLILGGAGEIGFEDNLVYASADNHGIAPAGHPEKFAAISEGDMKILNTPANGRENSHGAGNAQTNPDLTSIVLDGLYFSLGGSFTFAQQNDPDSGYVCLPCRCNANGQGGGPDERGYIYMFGAITQRQRGYVHRSSCTSTGYLKSYHFDNDLKFWNLPLFDAVENEIFPASLDLDTLRPGEIIGGTLIVRNEFVPIKLDSLRLSPPFYVSTPIDSFRWRHNLTVTFAPTSGGEYLDTLRFFNAYYHQWFAVPVRGVAETPSSANRGEPMAPAQFGLRAYPNPFNAQAQIYYSVPQAGTVSLEIYDLNGRKVETLVSGRVAAGDYRTSFDGSNLATGLYFAQLSAGSNRITQKLLLVK